MVECVRATVAGCQGIVAGTQGMIAGVRAMVAGCWRAVDRAGVPGRSGTVGMQR